MHLHGFYFRVLSRGTAARDTLYAPPQQRQAVTEFMAAGSTMTMNWVPTRPGNWLFHCHLIAHIGPEIRRHYHELGGPAGGAEDHRTASNHAYEGMAGLVIGIHVRPRANVVAPFVQPAASRALRLFVQKRPRYLGAAAGYGFVLQEGASPPAADSVRIPGSPIVLRRDEPVDVTIVNRTDELVSVHWHGIEVDSYYDGVADWSGAAGHTAPRIAPGDTFVVRLKPDRAGTFIYHTHQDESAQLSSGLYGPLIVLAPGEVHESATDRVFLIGRGGPSQDAPVLLNGTTTPEPLSWTTGVTYRMRFINITANDVEEVTLTRDSIVQQWRPFAKDGADLPPEQAVGRPSRVSMGPGETYDFELVPRAATDLTLAMVLRRRTGIIGSIRLPIHVR
jgi:FtsP/CotA-like multicopper oxidase with cupredoxin domain